MPFAKMNPFESSFPSGRFDPSGRSGDSGYNPTDFEAKRRQKAADIIAMGGLSPEQIIEANRLAFETERPAEGPMPGEANYDPNQFTRPGSLDQFPDNMEGAGMDNQILNRQPDQGVKFTDPQKKVSGVYTDLIKSAKESGASSKMGADMERYKLQALSNSIKEFQKNPPIDPEGVAQYQDMIAEFNRMVGVKGQQRAPSVPAESPAAQKDTRGWWDRLWNNQPEGWAAPGTPAPVGFKATKLPKDEINKLRAKAGLQPI